MNPQLSPRQSNYLIVVGALLSAALVFSCLMLAALVGVKLTSGHTSNSTPGTFRYSASGKGPTVTPAVWNVQEAWAGKGVKQTPVFYLPSSTLLIVWACAPGASTVLYNITVDIYFANGASAVPDAINALCTSGEHSGARIITPLSGAMYLFITTQTSWTLAIEVPGGASAGT